jgi:hypothetical protein
MVNWKTIKKGAYLYAKVPNHPNATKSGYVLEHRYVMERFLGRLLTKDEVVHHIDNNRHNNEISNLRLMTRSEHGKFHKKPLVLEERVCPRVRLYIFKETQRKSRFRGKPHMLKEV